MQSAGPPPHGIALTRVAFDACLEMLRSEFGRTGLEDDLDPEAERQLLRARRAGDRDSRGVCPRLPLGGRPFYTAPRGSRGAAGSFDLLFQGLEITTGGQRLHLREDLDAALRSRSIEPANFESHLAMFDLGMPPRGGFAIGLERLTCQVLNLPNVRQAVLYPGIDISSRRSMRTDSAGSYIMIR
jgi:nondiscriminating aspartyl-tRNA synthetase